MTVALVTNLPHQLVQNLEPFHVLVLHGKDQSLGNFFFGERSKYGFRNTSAGVQRCLSHRPLSTGRGAAPGPQRERFLFKRGYCSFCSLKRQLELVEVTEKAASRFRGKGSRAVLLRDVSF